MIPDKQETDDILKKNVADLTIREMLQFMVILKAREFTRESEYSAKTRLVLACLKNFYEVEKTLSRKPGNIEIFN